MMAIDDRIFASEDARIEDVGEALVAIDERRRDESLYRSLALSFLYEKVGKAMHATGQRRRELYGLVFHCEPPMEREYCRCHATLLYQCPDGPVGYGSVGIIRRMDAMPHFWVSRAKGSAA